MNTEINNQNKNVRGEFLMDKNYSIARRIWRILYPPLIFIGIQIVVMAIASFAVGMYAALNAFSGGTGFGDLEHIIEEALSIVVKQSMLILLISNLASIAVFLPIWMKTRNRAEIYKNENPAIVCLLIIGLFAGFNVVQMLIFALMDVMKYFPDYEEISGMIVTGPLIVQLISVGFVAPIVEELVFRGILITRMKWMPVWAAVLVQGFIFGLVHMNVFQGLYAFVAGILLGIVFIKFRSIIVVIAGHVAYNIVSILLSEIVSEEVIGIVVILSIVVLALCATFTAIIKKAKRLMIQQDNLPRPVFPPGYSLPGYIPQGPWSGQT